MQEFDVEKSVAELATIESYLDAQGTKLFSYSQTLRNNLSLLVAKAPLGTSVNSVSSLSKMMDSFEDMVKEVRKEIAKAKEVYLPEKFVDEEITTFNTDRFRVTCSDRTFASISDNEDDKAFNWLRENGYSALIKPTVNASALSGAAKEIMGEGKELPDDMFRVYNKTIVSITVKKPARG